MNKGFDGFSHVQLVLGANPNFSLEENVKYAIVSALTENKIVALVGLNAVINIVPDDIIKYVLTLNPTEKTEEKVEKEGVSEK